MQRKKVAIIGANGFIGLAVCKELSKQGYEVIGFVRKKKSEFYIILYAPGFWSL